MLYDKSVIAKLPFKVKFSFRKKNWYLFPQGWTWKKNVFEISYKAGINAYEHKSYYIIYEYQFSWLFIDINWKLQPGEHLSTSLQRHEQPEYDPLKYINGEEGF